MIKKPYNIQIYPSVKTLHSAYKSLLQHPPEGYIFIETPKSFWAQMITYLKKIRAIQRIYQIFTRLFNISIIVKRTNQFVTNDKDATLTLAIGNLYYNKKPWVLDLLDSPYSISSSLSFDKYTSFVANKNTTSKLVIANEDIASNYLYKLFLSNKKKITKVLQSNYCKAILCPHETALHFMKKNFPKDVVLKTKLLRHAVELPKHVIRKKHSNVQILFMGSINNPDDFYFKGGLITIRTFLKLKDQFPNINLVIRCKIPSELKQEVENIPSIKIIEQELSRESLLQIYKQSDILLLPSRVFVLMTFLESMAYGLPIVALDTYAVHDYLRNNYNAFVVSLKHLSANQDSADSINFWRPGSIKELQTYDTLLVERLAKKTALLIKNPVLRQRFGDHGRQRATTIFSIKTRNRKLKNIFDHALKN